MHMTISRTSVNTEILKNGWHQRSECVERISNGPDADDAVVDCCVT